MIQIPYVVSDIFDTSEQNSIDIIPKPLTKNTKNKLPKEDYQKNILINVIKCCIRMIVHRKYYRKLKKICTLKKIDLKDLINFVSPIMKSVVLSFGDLKILLMQSSE